MITRAVAPVLADIGPAIGWADERLADCGVAQDLRTDIQVCVEEALANLVLHGKADAGKDIRLAVGREAQTVVIQIEDRCQPFDPTNADFPPRATLENDVVGGAGLRLIRGLAASMRYDA